MVAQEILLHEPACALPIGAEEDGDTIVDDDREGRAHHRRRMSAGVVRAGQDIVQPGLNHHTGAVVLRKLQEFPAEAVPVANDGVNEVLSGLPLDCHLMLQTGEGVVPRRQSTALGGEPRGRERVWLLLPRVHYDGDLIGHQNGASESSSASGSSMITRRLK